MKRVVISSALLTLLVGASYYFYVTLPEVAVLKQRNPRSTALIELRETEYRRDGARPSRRQVWVSYDRISDHLKKAILISEDAGFFRHKGIDADELKAAFMKDWQTLSFARGGSTITMQLARNLYLSPSKNPLRKLREIAIAHQLEQSLTKERIFELYLNVVEWGKNIYGAEAAARHYFGKSAADLDLLQAATLAALLPSPRSIQERAALARRNLILSRLAQVGYLPPEGHGRMRAIPLLGVSRP
jgi:monofunctional biosynthetic peptidoglycan transglycosylase